MYCTMYIVSIVITTGLYFLMFVRQVQNPWLAFGSFSFFLVELLRQSSFTMLFVRFASMGAFNVQLAFHSESLAYNHEAHCLQQPQYRHPLLPSTPQLPLLESIISNDLSQASNTA